MLTDVCNLLISFSCSGGPTRNVLQDAIWFNTMGVESANTNVIGQRSPVVRDKYRSNLATKRRAHWSLKLGGACYLVTLHVNKKKQPPGLFFFKAQTSVASLTA